MNKGQIKKLLVSATDTIQSAMARINLSSYGIALVVDSHKNMLGTITDGDVRRAILKDISLTENVDRIMNRSPISLPAGSDDSLILRTMVEHGIRQMPIVDKRGKVVDIRSMAELIEGKEGDRHRVVLIAGGKGKRLRPLTSKTPKPMLSVGGKPILETLISQLNRQGFRNISIAVRYKSKAIENYFNDGKKFNASIDYIREKKELGTAGALGHIKFGKDTSIIVMNADILTKVNFRALLDYHRQHHFDVTVCIRKLQFQVPFGVVELSHNEVINIQEKPKFSYYVNAGIYVFDQAVQQSIPKNTHQDMPHFINHFKKKGGRVGSFPLIEYWLDIGRMDDYLLAHKEYRQIFGPRR